MTLQEYLVKIGWSVDEPSFKRFGAALATTAAKTAELSSAVLETAAAIELMVDKVARKYESLYYVSQRTGQSVKYIQSTQFAFKQIGMSAEDATASIEQMGSVLRTQPWLRAIFGNAHTPQEVASRLGKSGLPYFLQARFAEMIGMDEKTLFHLQRFANVEAAAEASFSRRQREAGIDPEKLSAGSANFGRELNSLESTLEIFGDRMAQDFIDPTTKAITNLTQIMDWINKTNESTKGWISTLAALGGTTAGIYLVEKALRRILGLGGATAVGTALEASGLGFLLRLGLGVTAPVAAFGYGLGLGGNANTGEQNNAARGAGPSPADTSAAANAWRKAHGMANPADLPKGSGARDRVNQAVNMLVQAGYPLSSAQGIAASLFSESGMKTNNPNPTSGMNGIAQWDTNRRNQFKQMFLHDVSQGSFEEQMQFLIWELNNTEKATGNQLRRGGMSARNAAGVFIHGAERPGPAGERSDMFTAGPLADALSQLAQQQNGGTSNNITLNSKTDVHVNSAGPDVMSTASAYGKAHDLANENLVRNVQGVLR